MEFYTKLLLNNKSQTGQGFGNLTPGSLFPPALFLSYSKVTDDIQPVDPVGKTDELVQDEGPPFKLQIQALACSSHTDDGI